MLFYIKNGFYEKNTKLFDTIINIEKQKKPFLIILNVFFILLQAVNKNNLINNFSKKVVLKRLVTLPFYFRNMYFKKINNK